MSVEANVTNPGQDNECRLALEQRSGAAKKDNGMVGIHMFSKQNLQHWARARSSAFYPLAIVAAVVASAPAAAQEYRARDVGGWTLAASEDGRGCFLTRQYDGAGKTRLLVGLDIDGTNHLSVLNDNWSIKPRQSLNLDFRLSNGGYSGQVVIGMASDGKKGFVTTFEAKFLTYFATSEALHIARGDVPVEQLDLAGSGAAVAELRQCVDAHRGGREDHAKDRKRSDLIPKDPFAPGLKRRPKP